MGFIFPDNTEVHNMHDFYSYTLTMDTSIFNHHVNDRKNDFFNWISSFDLNLAQKISKVSSISELQTTIRANLIEFENKLHSKIELFDKLPDQTSFRFQVGFRMCTAEKSVLQQLLKNDYDISRIFL